ncbi:MAG: hypothetical protein M3122_08060 [Actinomycetota bacterium]|nr:hypothetical protein [Actinomycetota bacterium]
MLDRKTVKDRIAAVIRSEFAEMIEALERDHLEYRRRLKLKEETRSTLEKQEVAVQRLHSARIELKKRFWEAYYEKDEQNEVVLSKIESERRTLERAEKKAEKSLEKARADFERADFDEVAEGFLLRTKANIAEDQATRHIDAIEAALNDLLSSTRQEVEKASQALRDDYEEPSFETVEERDAYVTKTMEILNNTTESYAPGSRWRRARSTRKTRKRKILAKILRPS